MIKAVLLHSTLVLSEPGKPDIYKVAVYNLNTNRKSIVWIEDQDTRQYSLGDCFVLKKRKGQDIYTIAGRCKK